MAEVAAADFHIGAGAFDVLGEEEGEIDDRSYSYWPHEFEHQEIYSSDSDDPFTHHEEEEEDYDDLFPHLHLHHQQPTPNPNPPTPNPDPVLEIDPYFSVVGMEQEQDLDSYEVFSEDFFVGRRATEDELNLDLNLNLQGYFSEEDLEDSVHGGLIDGLEEEDHDDVDVDVGVALCWDSLRLEEEWEDVDDRIDGIDAEDDGDVLLGLMMDYDEHIPNATIGVIQEVVDEGQEETMRNLDWQVLLQDVNDLERDHDFDLGPDDFVYPTEYDTFFGQFLENESAIRGSPPTAKAVVEGLPWVVLTQDDIQNKGGLCAVCKDEIATEEKAKQLPCLHYYHGECILPWLNMRNTCPVCRFELPTDDAEYEQRRGQRSAGVSQVRYNFEMFVQD